LITVLPPNVTVAGGLNRGADDVCGGLNRGAAVLGTLNFGTSTLGNFFS